MHYRQWFSTASLAVLSLSLMCVNLTAMKHAAASAASAESEEITTASSARHPFSGELYAELIERGVIVDPETPLSGAFFAALDHGHFDVVRLFAGMYPALLKEEQSGKNVLHTLLAWQIPVDDGELNPDSIVLREDAFKRWEQCVIFCSNSNYPMRWGRTAAPYDLRINGVSYQIPSKSTPFDIVGITGNTRAQSLIDSLSPIQEMFTYEHGTDDAPWIYSLSLPPPWDLHIFKECVPFFGTKKPYERQKCPRDGVLYALKSMTRTPQVQAFITTMEDHIHCKGVIAEVATCEDPSLFQLVFNSLRISFLDLENWKTLMGFETGKDASQVLQEYGNTISFLRTRSALLWHRLDPESRFYTRSPRMFVLEMIHRARLRFPDLREQFDTLTKDLLTGNPMRD